MNNFIMIHNVPIGSKIINKEQIVEVRYFYRDDAKSSYIVVDMSNREEGFKMLYEDRYDKRDGSVFERMVEDIRNLTSIDVSDELKSAPPFNPTQR